MMGDGEEPESKARGAWLAAFVAKSRLRVAGPNCMGAYSYRERLFGYPNTELCRLAPGSVACLFQSGGTIQFWMQAAAERGLRYSYYVTSGNEPDLGLADYLNFVIDDPQTRQVVLFIEGIRRPEAFMHAAGRALAIGKPILAIKTGATAQSPATFPPISPCANATASSITVRSTISSKRRWPSTADGCRRDRASASSPRQAQRSISSMIMPPPKARSFPTSRMRPRRRSSP